MRKLFSIALVSIFASVASAENVVYVGAGLQQGTYEEDDLSDYTLPVINLLAGYNFNDNNAIEIRYLSGLDEGSNNESIGKVGLEIEEATSVFYRYNLHFLDRFILYGLIGYTDASFNSKFYTYNISNNFEINGVSYGAGLGLYTSRSVIFNMESISYFSDQDDGAGYSGVNFNINYVF